MTSQLAASLSQLPTLRVRFAAVFRAKRYDMVATLAGFLGRGVQSRLIVADDVVSHVVRKWRLELGTPGSGFKEVKHAPWNVWPAVGVQFDCDVAQQYGQQFAETLSRQPDSAFIADGSPVTVSRPRRIAGSGKYATS